MTEVTPFRQTSHDSLMLDALHQLQRFSNRPRQENTDEAGDEQFARDILSSLVSANTFSGDPTVQRAAEVALQTLQVTLRDWFHTAWAQDLRDQVIESFEYDVFAEFRFDLQTELQKTQTLFSTGKLDQDTYTDLEARLKLLYAELPHPFPARDGSSCADVTMAEVSPSPANIYTEYPAYIRDTFTLDRFVQAFPDVHAWPKAPFVQIFSTNEAKMCSRCIADSAVRSCVYGSGQTVCVRCGLDKQPCTINNTGSSEDGAPRAKRRRIATPRGEEAMKTLAFRKVTHPHEEPTRPIASDLSTSAAAADGGVGPSRARLQQIAPERLLQSFSAPCQDVKPALSVEETKSVIRSRIHLLQRQLRSLDDLESKLRKYGSKALTMRRSQ
ncbi:hypothetical protein BDW22DRAFT_1359816, partial [Trametopsis cervina]